MPKKFFQKFLPSREAVRSKKYLAWLGKGLYHPSLWSLNRESIAGGFEDDGSAAEWADAVDDEAAPW